MGYSHYWKMPNKLINQEVLNDVKGIIERYENIVQVGLNAEGELALNEDVIMFNGKGELAHETFCLIPNGETDFCKTNGKPYDIAVCETLLVFKHHYGDEFEIGSDGFYVYQDEFGKGILDGNWNEAFDNVKKHFGYEFELVPKIERSGGSKYYFYDVLSDKEHKERLLEDKRKSLIVNKQEELNFRVVDKVLDDNNDLHILCQRYSDNSYVVWTSYYTGDVETSYENFYSGEYDMDIEEGFEELFRRSGKEKEVGNVMEHNEVIGSDEYGEKPYLISESVGNYSYDVIVYGYDEQNALDNYVEHGQEKYDWDVPEIPEDSKEGNYYMANGYYPIDLDRILILEVDKEFVNKINRSNEKENPNELEM